MNISITKIDDLRFKGVYKIINNKTHKYYIGSTNKSFVSRFTQHVSSLRNNSHKNPYLQNAWNKYGEEEFTFVVLEICTNPYEREQWYLDNVDKKLCYNINTKATGPCLDKEVIEKQAIARKKFYKECLPYYYKVKENQITLEDVPKQYLSMVKSRLNFIPWNKDKKIEDTSYLRVTHKSSDRTNVKNTVRNKLPIVYVYDANKNFIASYRSAKDLEELSITENLPINSRFKTERMGKAKNFLATGNINKAIKTKQPYKGLYFTIVPLHPGKDDVNKPKSVEVWNDNTEVTK